MAKLLSFFSALVLAAGFSVASQAATTEPSADQAKLVFYRADESSKTRRIKLDANIDGQKLGRLKYNRTIVTSVDAGEYQLGSSVRGTEALAVDVKPGKTYFVHMQLKKLGQTVTPTLVLVEEQVVLTQLPEDVAGTI